MSFQICHLQNTKDFDLYNESQHCTNKLLKPSSGIILYYTGKKEMRPILEEIKMSDRLHFWANYCIK